MKGTAQDKNKTVLKQNALKKKKKFPHYLAGLGSLPFFMSHGNKIKINYECSPLKTLEAAKCKQTCRTGRNKIPEMCVKEQLPKAALFLPVHNESLSFPREAVLKREHERPLQRGGEGGTEILQKGFITLTRRF